ncbi:MAG TPA: ATP-binding cassette domain-containing protein [Methanomicrobiales archaeon]|nr:ATP-binding cassette domain-containing protein [Methanomicrobiales archaeon]
MEPAIEFLDVHFAYPNRPEALAGVHVAIERGKKVAIVGPNGAGKTTLLLMCNGTLRPQKGEVRLFGSPLQYDRKSLLEVRRRVGMVFQNSDAQLFAPTVYQDVAFGPMNLHMSPDRVRECVTDALYAVGLTGYERRPPHHLSGGEKKRVAIAGVLAMQPDILIFDEPTGALDPAGAAGMMDLLDELHARGTLIIISTHDVELAYRWADEVILMAEGDVLARASPPIIFSDGDLLRHACLTMPKILELYNELSLRDLIPNGTPPDGVLDMTHRIAEATGRPLNGRRGTIYLSDADHDTVEAIRRMVTASDVRYIGAMGTRAKRLCEEAGIALDFTHDVIDRCLLKAILGQNTLIITSGGMLSRVHERASAFSRESLLPVPVEPVRVQAGEEEKKGAPDGAK